MLKKKMILSLCFSLLLVSSAFAPGTFAASVETNGDLEVNGQIWSTSGGFKFPDGSTLTTAGLNGLLFNVGFVVDNSGSNAGNLLSGAIKFGAGDGATGEGIASQRIGSGNVNGIDFYTNSTSRLAITNNGKVGIGTRAPTEALDVIGNIKGSGSLVIDNGNTNNGAVNASALTFGLSSGEGIASKRTQGGNRYGLDLYTNFIKRMSISQTGNVAIGTDATTYRKLEVTGDVTTAFRAETTAAAGNGIIGVANNGSDSYGIWGQSTSGYAGMFSGKVYVSGNLDIGGTLSKSGGSFRIDHPVDPANKYLSHSFVESPDMKNIYDGVVVLDGNGEAVVDLPDWFQALNRDFRYQLTAIGAPGPDLHIADEVRNNSFRIAGGKANGKVSWQVTGIRHDAWANAHRIPVEENKTAVEAGSYIHPELFGQPETKGVQHRLKK
jgi:hypothetical protein